MQLGEAHRALGCVSPATEWAHSEQGFLLWAGLLVVQCKLLVVRGPSELIVRILGLGAFETGCWVMCYEPSRSVVACRGMVCVLRLVWTSWKEG